MQGVVCCQWFIFEANTLRFYKKIIVITMFYNRIVCTIVEFAYTAGYTKLFSSTGHRGTVSGDRVCPHSVSKLQCRMHPTMVHPPRLQCRYLSNPMELGEARGETWQPRQPSNKSTERRPPAECRPRRLQMGAGKVIMDQILGQRTSSKFDTRMKSKENYSLEV